MVRRRLCRVRIGFRIWSRTGNVHYVRTTCLHDRIVRAELDLERLILAHFAVTKPVVGLKLNPGGREKIKRARGDESVPGENPAADLARTWFQQPRLRFRVRLLSRHISTEALALRSHVREVQVIVFSVRPARDQIFRPARPGIWPSREVGGVVQISITQNIAESEKTQHAQTGSPCVPSNAVIPGIEKTIKEPPAERLAATGFVFGFLFRGQRGKSPVPSQYVL